MSTEPSNGNGRSSDTLLSQAASHPFLTSGLVLAGAGLAYAAARTIGNVTEAAREVHVEASIAIDRPPEELYAFWRDFKIQDAEIINEKENELIAWRSLDLADVVNAGSVRFHKGPQGHGTYIKVNMNCRPPAGKAGAALASLFGAGPQQLIRDDLRRFKQLMETGEIATTDGQASGRSEEAEPLEKIENSLDQPT